MKIKRKSENEFENRTVMSVSFASYINENIALNTVTLRELFKDLIFIFFKYYLIFLAKIKPLTLQELCRFKIRMLIRESIRCNHSNYYELKKRVKRVDEDSSHSDSNPTIYTRRLFLNHNAFTEADFRLLMNS